MKKGFPFPLPESALAEFCHPAETSGLSVPMRMGNEIVAANGYMAIRCRRGAWIDAEFPEAWTDFSARVEKLPWARFETITKSDAWDALDLLRGALGRHGPLAVWNGGKIHACPIWRVRDALVRLSMLQLVARLPRAEVFTGPPANADDGMFFRFSGGIGIVARDARLTHGTYEVFQPRADVLNAGTMMERSRMPAPTFALPGNPWPPVDMTEVENAQHGTHGIDFL